MNSKNLNSLKIEYLPIDNLKPYVNNAKLHPDWQVAQIEVSIREFGMNDPVAVDEKTLTIIEGHGRLRACQQLGFTKVPVIKLGHLTSVQQKAYRIAHNKIGENTSFDFEIMAQELESINADGLDLLLTGFDADELLKMGIDTSSGNGNIDEDEVPIVEWETPVIQTGDLIELGRHRLLCGDATKHEDVAKLMNGKKADMVFTDPPYGVNYHDTQGRNIIGDNMSMDEFSKFLTDTFVNYYNSLIDKTVIYICFAHKTCREFYDSLEDAGFYISNEIVWVKDVQTWGFADYRYKYEPIIYGWKQKYTHSFYGDRKQVNVWECASPSSMAGRKDDFGNTKPTMPLHPNKKPVELIIKAMQNSSMQNQIVIDLFLGSGSTLIACEKINRICYGMEIEPHYCDIITQRYVKFTGNDKIKINGKTTNWNDLKPK